MPILAHIQIYSAVDPEVINPVWEWLIGNFSIEAMTFIIFLTALIFIQREFHKSNLRVHERSLDEKDKELKNVTDDRNFYRNKLLKKVLPSSNDIGMDEIKDNNGKEES